MFDWILSSLLLVCGFLLLAGSLQGLLLSLTPARTPWHSLCWSVYNTLLVLSVPAAALAILPDYEAGPVSSRIVAGGIFTLTSLGLGVLGLYFILGRRWPSRTPVWDTRQGFMPSGPAVLGSLALVILLSVFQFQPLPWLGAVCLFWVFFFLLRRQQVSTPPFQTGLQLNRSYQPAALLGLWLALILIGYGSCRLVELMPRPGFEASSRAWHTLLVMPLPAFLVILLSLLRYMKNGQDHLAGAYLVSSLIPQFTILPALIITWSGWSLDWPGLAALTIAALLLLALENRARGPLGITPLLLLLLAAAYPLYLAVWRLLWW
ncbi:MAG: hypothetical protein HPY50_05885 [Firmicutes bacterium]|nr:hypothetical protein [Bacillota bacterium]